MSYYLTHYQGVGEHDYQAVQFSEYPTFGEAISHLEEITGPARLWEALEYVIGGFIWWWTDDRGWDITNEPPNLEVQSRD